MGAFGPIRTQINLCLPGLVQCVDPRHPTRPRRILDRTGLTHPPPHFDGAPAAMASRKLVLGLTAARRLRSRAPVLVSSSPFLEASTSTSDATAATATRGSGVGPWGLLLSSGALTSTRPVSLSAGDAPGSSAADHRCDFPFLWYLAPCCLKCLFVCLVF